MNNSIQHGLFLCLLGLLMAACVNNNAEKTKPSIQDAATEFSLETVEETDPDGNLLQFTRRDSDGLKEGVFIKTTAKGIKLEEAHYSSGKLNGKRILFYPSGDTLIVESYLNDAFNGSYKSFYPNGQLKVLCTYEDNSIEGKWLQYFETGQLKEEVLFVGNAENGPFKEYHPNGQISVEGAYKDGDNEHGPLKFFDEQGQHYKTMECNMGICRTVWTQEKIKSGKAKGKKSKG
ncbi:MAG: toxin-antitoxin system YwqK family antitoxin [Haliscomenobacter sp.]|uniref:toxin-antitoxin system YwqK family antitoxin n=1 Tax=Haliscomenobacter sp. TaxID=2717303 RepID=UPI0029A0F967|nr:toxin-antitoxin system YwqK family antitoxin [Haliscomenobacter sp.]MDX2068246.1 toxin-antitoxin system YwqK family antitoxin [Haliscomenobacter sp.]